MRSLEEKQTKTLAEEAFNKKYNYLNLQNSDAAYIQFSRPKILQTISEQAFSEDKGSISNRSQNIQNTHRIQKNLSQHHIGHNLSSPFKNLIDQPVRTLSHLVDYSRNLDQQLSTEKLNPFQKNPASTHKNQQLYPLSKHQCLQCPLYVNKIAELQNSYQLLLMAKNEELQECKIIIKALEQNLKQFQKRSLHQIEKNKKFRSQMQKKNTEQHYQRQRENEIIEYLKNRQIVLLEQMQGLQNKIYIKDVRFRKSSNRKKQASPHIKLDFSSKGFSTVCNHGQFNGRGTIKQNIPQFNEEISISQCSAKTFDQQFDINQNVYNSNVQILSGDGRKMITKSEVYSSTGSKTSAELIQRVPLNEICLKDNLLVSELKIKIEQTKSLQNLLFPENN